MRTGCHLSGSRAQRVQGCGVFRLSPPPGGAGARWEVWRLDGKSRRLRPEAELRLYWIYSINELSVTRAKAVRTEIYQ